MPAYGAHLVEIDLAEGDKPNNTKNTNRGKMKSRMGNRASPATSSHGTKAKSRYSSVPKAIATGRVQFFRKVSMGLIWELKWEL